MKRNAKEFASNIGFFINNVKMILNNKWRNVANFELK